ncbi:hypothetical protein PRUPE_4G032800 [Prunus persica]|uniref:Uncharacterized protein n=1 Tax=Prunus persica TaxID=3760 RepID=A0A251PF07_PRUPE|nr:hypothetical protein PRUPE_4G032800 [Prunus persica]
MNICVGICGANPTENNPVDPSLSLFQAVKTSLFPDLLSNPSNIFGRTPISSWTTKFPLSKRSAAEPLDGTKILVDQIQLCFPSTSSRFPLLLIVKLANVSVTERAFSLLATQTTLRGNIVLCHIPTYLLAELLGLKKPNSKMWPGETRVCPSANGCEEVML